MSDGPLGFVSACLLKAGTEIVNISPKFALKDAVMLIINTIL